MKKKKFDESLLIPIDMNKYLNNPRNMKVIYVYGTTGVGKTDYAYKKAKDKTIFRLTSYKKNGKNFTNYMGEEVIILDNFISSISIDEMNDILDGYPLFLPSRYVDKVACYHDVYILSRVNLDGQYKYEQVYEPEKYKAFVRRINTVVHKEK